VVVERVGLVQVVKMLVAVALAVVVVDELLLVKCLQLVQQLL
jgi:hypothetical protein